MIEIEPVPAYDEALKRYFKSRGVTMTRSPSLESGSRSPVVE